MKYLMILLVGVCLLFASVPATADQAEDEAAIRKILDEFPVRYSAHDTKALLPYLDENVEFFEKSYRSHAEAKKGYDAAFKRQKTIAAKMGDASVVFVTPDVAIARGVGEYTGLVDADGKPLAPYKAIGVVVVVKKKGSWLIRAIYEKALEE